MTSETIAGLFGVLATLIGVAAGYALSFSRDRRLQRDRFREVTVNLVRDLNVLAEILSENELMDFDTSSLEAFRQQGFVSQLQPDLSQRLIGTYWSIIRINHLTDRMKETLNVFMIRGELKKLGEQYHDLSSWYFQIQGERKKLIEKQISAIPKLALDLDKAASN